MESEVQHGMISNGDCKLGEIKEGNLKEVLRLKEEANKLFNEGHVEKSIEVYSKAIDVSGLSDEGLAVLYSNRSAAYLKADEERIPAASTDWRSLALSDAKTALTLRPDWFRAHYRVGRAYKSLSRFREALNHFDAAVGLETGRPELKTARDDCRRLVGEQTRNERPETIADQLKKLNEVRGTSLTPEYFIKMEKKYKKTNNPIGYVLEGSRYRDGVACEQSYEKAAECFSKAASQGNADGKYYLGCLTRDGRGVKQDFELALKLFKEAADCPPKVFGNHTNTGVAEAEHALGLMYEEGVGVSQNPILAAKWYERSSDHGCCAGSNNLALLYMEGRGVEKNVERAVQYFRLAASRQSSQAMRSLALHYLQNERDAVKAMEWHNKALEHGDVYAQLQAGHFEEQVKLLENDDVLLNNVLAFEADHGLVKKNLTFKERVSRMLETETPGEANLTEIIERICQPVDVPYSKMEKFTSLTDRFDPKMLEECASNGSKTAQSLLEAQTHFLTGLCFLISSPVLDRKMQERIVGDFAKCFRLEHIVAAWPVEVVEKARSLVDEILNSSPDDLSADLEKDARVCYSILHMNSLPEIKVFLQKSIRKFPKEPFFYQMICPALAYMQENDESLREASKGLKLFPQNVEILYSKAALMKLIEPHTTDDVINATNEFLSVAPPDHRKVPDCYYTIAYECFADKTRKTSKSKKNKSEINPEVMKYYNMGIEAEKIQLPCFLPYESKYKSLLQGFMGVIGASFPPETPIQTKIKTQDTASMMKITDPNRIAIVTDYRQILGQMNKIFDTYNRSENPYHIAKLTVEGKYDQKAPPSTAGLKPITLREMDTSKDRVYKGRVIKFISIEDALVGNNCTGMVGEDKNGDVQRLAIYKIDQKDRVQEKLGFGCRVSIMNPYMRLALDGKLAIRVDDEKSVFLHTSERELKRCRYCGKGDADKTCGRCKRAMYCSRECQEKDWKIMKHKYICA